MATLGIVGGIAPESTIEYYRFLIAEYRARVRNDRYPAIVINSIDLTKMIGMIAAGELEAVTGYLSGEVLRLARSGADLAVLASNTPHIIFDELRRRSPIPMLSIVEATCDAARARGLRRLGLFGTRFTMESGFYATVFARAGMAIVVPGSDERTYLHDKYMSELVNGLIVPETRERMVAIAARLRDEEGIDGLILGGPGLAR